MRILGVTIGIALALNAFPARASLLETLDCGTMKVDPVNQEVTFRSWITNRPAAPVLFAGNTENYSLENKLRALFSNEGGERVSDGDPARDGVLVKISAGNASTYRMSSQPLPPQLVIFVLDFKTMDPKDCKPIHAGLGNFPEQ